MSNLLTVYNTCGINQDNTDWYSRCIESVLNQNYKTDIVISSCLNSSECLYRLKSRFGDNLKIVFYNTRYIVNITFNKTVLIAEQQQKYDGFFFLDSGVMLTDRSSISSMVERLDTASMITLQVDYDTGFEGIGYQQNSLNPQIVNQDFIVPLGKGINLHAQIFSKDILNLFGLIIPDVFAAFCTESTFSFLNACVEKDWVIVKDIIAHHNKAVDGPSSSQPHHSPVYRNPWNNLLYNRNALDFITNQDCIDCGLGYEECGNIMMHNKDAYNDTKPKYKQQLINNIKKYFYSNKQELDYDSIKYELL